MFTDGTTIYSYGHHFMAGARHVRPDGSVFFFINWNKDYSVSTRQHMSYIDDATHGMERLYLDNPEHAHRYYELDDKTLFKNAMKTEHMSALMKAKDWYEEAMTHRAGTQVQGYKMREANKWVDRANAIQKFCKLGKRIVPHYELSEEMQRKVREKERIKHQKEREAIKDWLTGKKDTYPRTSRPYLRLKMEQTVRAGEGDCRIYGEALMIQTTWGIKSIPYDVVKCVIPYAERCYKEQVGMEMYDAIDKINNVMQTYAKEQQVTMCWRLDKITSKGVIKFGCHHIPLKMAQRIQAQAKEMRSCSVSATS
jgi:hypothetical protein